MTGASTLEPSKPSAPDRAGVVPLTAAALNFPGCACVERRPAPARYAISGADRKEGCGQ